ncbi:hypothetical protein C0991_009552, partial [Blastosporella zonata]
MLERFLPRWLQQPTSKDHKPTTTPSEGGLPFPVGTEKPSKGLKSKWNDRDLKLVPGAAISYPIPRSSPLSLSLTGLDAPDAVPRVPGERQSQYPYAHSSPTRSGPSNVEWKVGSSPTFEQEEDVGYTNDGIRSMPALAPPAVIRLPSKTKFRTVVRSLSEPTMSTPHESPSSSSSSSSASISMQVPKGLKLNTNPTFTQSTSVLGPDARATVEAYGYAYGHPLVKQLSPIEEQDYFSPVSLRTPISLPNAGSNASIACTMSNPSPSSSHKSESTRPSPSYSTSPFITRQVNRTVSQTSSRTQASTTSIPRASAPTSAAVKPTPHLLPPLSFAPPFPGPHPSHDSVDPQLRPRRLPTIEGSCESAVYDIASEVYGGEEDSESLHPESFITASPRDGNHDTEMDIADASFEAGASVDTAHEDARSTHSHGSVASMLPNSASESWIGRRWERDAALGSGVVTFRTKHQWLTDCTPAFWTFWLGFLFPVLWFVGGWHFTRFGEQPSRLTFWEFYFNAGFWKEKVFDCVLCCGNRKFRTQPKEVVASAPQGFGPDVERQMEREGPRLPRWVAEKQSSDAGRMRLQDPKRSLRGISFGYPFVPRPVSM